MTDTSLSCPTCGALLSFIRRETDPTTGELRFLWRCENGHVWAQTDALGWVALDPEDVPEETVTITLESE